jgi:hypothetical protein
MARLLSTALTLDCYHFVTRGLILTKFHGEENTVVIDKLIVAHLVKKFPTVHKIRMPKTVHTRICHRALS